MDLLDLVIEPYGLPHVMASFVIDSLRIRPKMTKGSFNKSPSHTSNVEAYIVVCTTWL